MIPSVSISNLITLPFLIFISLRFYFSFRETKNKNIEYFFATFLFLTIMEGLLVTPGLIFKDLIKIAAVFAIYPLFTFLCLAFLGAIPLHILRLEKIKKSYFIVMVLIALSVTVINLINLQPAVTYQRSPFIYWEDTRGITMNIFIGIVSGLILLFILSFFSYNGFKSPEKYVRTRSFLIAGGVIGFFLSAIINFVWGAPTENYITSFIAALLLILGSFMIFVGVSYKYKGKQKEISYPAIKKEESPRIQW